MNCVRTTNNYSRLKQQYPREQYAREAHELELAHDTVQ